MRFESPLLIWLIFEDSIWLIFTYSTQILWFDSIFTIRLTFPYLTHHSWFDSIFTIQPAFPDLTHHFWFDSIFTIQFYSTFMIQFYHIFRFDYNMTKIIRLTIYDSTQILYSDLIHQYQYNSTHNFQLNLTQLSNLI